MSLFALFRRFQALESRRRLRLAFAAAALLALALAYTRGADQVRLLDRVRSARKAELAELTVLRTRHREALALAGTRSDRIAAVRPDDTPEKLLDEIGIRGKGLQLRSLKGEEAAGVFEDAAEVQVDGLTGNELVNLLYRLETANRPVLLKKASIRVRFDDPGRLDATLSLALLKAAPPGNR